MVLQGILADKVVARKGKSIIILVNPYYPCSPCLVDITKYINI